MKNLIIGCLFLSSCVSNTNEEVGSIDTAIEIKEPETIVLLEGESFMVWGHDTVDYESIKQAEVKFEPYINFSDFKVGEIYKGKRPLLQLKREDSNFWSYRTKIRNGYKEPVNFAGHYRFVYWGCGSPCQAAVLIDVKTGKIYNAPSASLGYEHFKDSRMLITNPPLREDEESSLYGSKTGFYNVACAYCHPYIFIWNEEKKRFEERKPSPY
ncbi:MAG: hypothetical protein R2800_07095 [Flavipsychrobacter sp.]